MRLVHTTCIAVGLLFVTELSRTHPDAPLFTEIGIDIMTVKEFVRGFMGKAIEHQANTKSCKLSSLAYDTLL